MASAARVAPRACGPVDVKTDSATAASKPRRGRGETRARLVAATVELIRARGLAALTVERVAHAADISQPGFYNHFANLDELLDVVLGEGFGDVARGLSRTCDDAFADYRVVNDLLDGAIVRTAYARMLDAFVSRPELADLFLRFRCDPTVLQGGVVRIAERAGAEFTRQTLSLAKNLGVGLRHQLQVVLHAERLLSMYYGAAEALLQGRHDRDLVLDAITRDTLVLNRGLVMAIQSETP